MKMTNAIYLQAQLGLKYCELNSYQYLLCFLRQGQDQKFLGIFTIWCIKHKGIAKRI